MHHSAELQDRPWDLWDSDLVTKGVCMVQLNNSSPGGKTGASSIYCLASHTYHEEHSGPRSG